MTDSATGLSALRTRIDRLKTELSLAVFRIKEEKAALADAQDRLETARRAQEFVQHAAQQVQQEAHKQIARVVSRCLSAVFQERYELRILFERKRGKTEADFIYMKDGHKVNPHVDSGGVMEVASLALRLASLVMTMPPARRLLVLDEPFLGLSKENLRKMGMLLESLSKELGVQIIMCTHDEQLQVGKVIRF